MPEEESKNEDLSITKDAKIENEQNMEPKLEQKQEAEAEKEPGMVETRKMSVLEWLKTMKWRTNPFIFNILPSLFVGYRNQTERITMALEERHKFLLILGPTGSGKTTLLKWLSSRLNKSNFDTLYIGKSPQRPEDFVEIFNNKYSKSWYAFWKRKIKNIYEIQDFLSRKLNKRNLVILVDEAHEANLDVLEWLRVLNDQIENMSVVLSGLPNFEDHLRNNLETFAKRVTTKIELLSLTKEETKELIKKRIQYVGGDGSEFSDEIISSIYEYTGGFPREIIRICDELVNSAIINGTTKIRFDIKETKEEIRATSTTTTIIDRMTPMQKEILELLSKKPLTPGQIANSLDLTKYKSRQHAVRSVNNIVKALHESGYLERRKEEKAFVYSLSPRINTLFVKR